MSPYTFRTAGSDAVESAIARLWAQLGVSVRDARLAKRWTTVELAGRAGVSRTSLYTLERGEQVSMAAAVRLIAALGLRIDIDLVDPRRRERQRPNLSVDPVHSAIGEYEAAHLRQLGYPVGIDEPYQHYQFAGRGDIVAWHIEKRALLHFENRTRFPDLQDTAGAYNAKRAYLGADLAARLGVGRWASETHVMAALWSSEVLHLLRLRAESFRALCPDPTTAFESWWNGEPPLGGKTSALIVVDPLARPGQHAFLDLEAALKARPRYAGYAQAASAMMVGSG